MDPLQRRDFLGLAVAVALATSLAAAQPQRAADAPFQTVRGRVVADDPAAAPLQRVEIALTADNFVADPSFTDEQGRFEVAVPGSGDYSLRFTKPGFAPQDVRRGPGPTNDDLQIRLARGAVVNGRVADQFGDPVLAAVRLRRGADPTGAGADAGTVQTVVRTDDRGEFRIGGRDAGRYEIVVDPLGGQGDAPPAIEGGAPVVVDLRAGQETTVNLSARVTAEDPRGVVVGRTPVPVVDRGAAIRGYVSRPDGRPVAAAFITLVGPQGTRLTSSAADGTYDVTGLPPGAYRLTATKVSAAFGSVERTVTVRPAQVLDGIALTITMPSAVAGTVLDGFGEPVPNINVELLQAVRRDGRRTLARVAGVRNSFTDDRGQYRLFGARAGEHYVLASREARVLSDMTAQGPERSVRVYYPGTSVVSEAATVRVLTGQETAGVDITFRPSEGARVTGYAFDSSGNAVRFPVGMMESSRAGAPLTARRQSVVRVDGSFAFLNVAPGDYVIQALLPPDPDRPTEFGVGFVTVGGIETPPLVIRTARGTTVKGRVLLEGDRTPVDLESFAVGADTTDLDYDVAGLDSPGTGVGEDGTFELQLHGPMRIVSRAAPRGWWLKSATIGAIDVSEQPYAFTGQGEVTLTVVFADSAGTVSGRVTGAGGEPAPGAYLVVLPADESRRYVGSPYVRFLRAVDGAYREASLPPGDYVILAVDRFDAANERQDPDAWRLLAPFGERITVGERQSVTRDLQVVRRAGM